MKVISLFSGVGGLELDEPAETFCEIDADCRAVLSHRFPESRLHDDVMTLSPHRADVVFGGWPCQDLSVAGLRRGLAGEKSGLFFRMVDVALEARAHTVVAENVPNLLRLEEGENFRLVVQAFQQAGYEYVAWRTLNARQFSLPHQRRRVFIVASQKKSIATRLFRDPPEQPTRASAAPQAAGFYWTAGLQGLNYSLGYSPTLKVGSSLSIPSPPAVFFEDCVRAITADEALRLQGFSPEDFVGTTPKAIHRMMGNAVARPVGRFVANCVLTSTPRPSKVPFVPTSMQFQLFSETDRDFFRVRRWPSAGMVIGSEVMTFVEPADVALDASLDSLIDKSNRSRLSERAVTGLLSRLGRSGKPCPPDLLLTLKSLVA